MSFDDFMRDNINVLKADGTQHEGIKCLVSGSDTIIIMSPKFAIDHGDLVVRTTSLGNDETYKVIDPKEGANKSYGTRAFTGNPLILND